MALRAGFHGTVGQSSAQVVDGSLKFDGSKSQYLARTPSSAGNRRTWTWSAWLKRYKFADDNTYHYLFSTRTSSSNRHHISYNADVADELFTYDNTNSNNKIAQTNAKYRDTGWYHVVVIYDTTNGDGGERLKFFINGVENDDWGSYQTNSENFEGLINSVTEHRLGGEPNAPGYFYGSMSQVYFIDGQALGPGYFGYTDPLTNTWRPKKYTGGFNNPNNGTTWSSDITGTPLNSTVGEAFDGSLATGAQPDSLLTWTPSSTITAQNQIRLYIYQNGYTSQYGTFEQNGTNLATSIASQLGDGVAGWITLPSNTITELKWSRDTGVGSWALRAVEVDGYVLLDGAGDNSFHLPFDGNSPIGQDKSGRGNNWTPVNFGGSNSLEKATGALPILNTDGGGKVARVGTRTDENASSLVLALPLVGISSDVSNQINSGSTTKTVAVTGATASTTRSNLYGGSYYFNGPTNGASAATQYAIVSDSNSEFAFGTNDFTMEFWVWGTDWTGGSSNQDQVIFGHDGSDYAGFYIPAGVFSYYTSSANIPSSNKPTLLDNKWYHVAVSRESGTSRVFLDGVLVGSASDNTNHPTGSIILARNPSNNLNQFNGYIQDVRIYKGVAKYTSNFIPASTDPDILPDTPSGVSGSSKLTKITEGAVAFDGSGDYLSITDNGDFTLDGDFTVECFFNLSTTSGNNAIFGLGPFAGGNNTKVLFRYESSGNFNYYIGSDVLRSRPISKNSWYHLAVVRNSNVVKIFLNGTQVGADISHSATISGNVHIGSGNSGGSEYNTMTGFISNFRIIKGTALYTSDFTPPTRALTDVTNTTLLCCKSPTSATAFDVSPGSITANGNAAATNFNPFNTDINTVRGQESGYCTWNPLTTTTSMLFDGNLLSRYTSGAWKSALGTIGISSGKWYWENQLIDAGIGHMYGIALPTAAADSHNTDIFGVYAYDGTTFAAGAQAQSYASAFSPGDIIGVALDLTPGGTSGTLTYYKNGVSLGVAFSALDCSKTYFPWVLENGNASTGGSICNFGQKPFKFPPPAGFQPLNAANVRPSTVIARPDQYVGVTTYSGDSSSNRKINLNLKPDFVWFKSRTAANSHVLVDSVRGGNKVLYSDQSVGDVTASAISSFDIDGMTINDIVGDGRSVNNSGRDIVAWCWKAGGNKNTFNIDDVGYATASAAGLTAGTETIDGASINTKSGFSIIKYTASGGGSIDHGLGKTPAFIIQKTTGTGNWNIWHSALGGTQYLNFTTTDVQTDSGNFSSAPTSTVFNIGGNGGVNGTCIAYLWHDVPGLQKFGEYSGNLSSNGPTIITGFRPSVVIIKRYDSSGDHWFIHDAERNKTNVVNARLYPSWDQYEFTNVDALDFLSNGFKLRTSDTSWNASGGTYIYAAWAEAPTFNLYGGQSNAR